MRSMPSALTVDQRFYMLIDSLQKLMNIRRSSEMNASFLLLSFFFVFPLGAWHLPQTSGSPAIPLSCHLFTTILVGIPFFPGSGRCCYTIQFATVTIYSNNTFWLILLPSVFPPCSITGSLMFAVSFLQLEVGKCGGLAWEELPGAH